MFGIINNAKIPMITITIKSSSRVNPLCFLDNLFVDIYAHHRLNWAHYITLVLVCATTNKLATVEAASLFELDPS
jgi:hypothetical protein